MVINVLATKKIAIRGGAWSSIGKIVEKPLILNLCDLCEIDKKYIDSSIHKRDRSKIVDREVDFKLINLDCKIYRVEVKLMGKGNPESADVVFARDTDIIIADTLSKQNKNQLIDNNRLFLELKNNLDVVNDFRKKLQKIKIPYN